MISTVIKKAITNELLKTAKMNVRDGKNKIDFLKSQLTKEKKIF